MPAPLRAITPLPYDPTTHLLTEWAARSRSGHGLAKLRYPEQTPFQALRGSSVRTPLINDETAQAVDAAVARLCDLDREGGEVLVAYFIERKPLTRIARQCGMNRWQAQGRLDAAVAWISGRLDREEY
ncbi:MAG: antiterminator Q family protein [Halioglobus sp.]|jgi:hypothetical protein